MRPSQALVALRDEVRERFAAAGLPEPLVFGSVARGQDSVDSDLDLLVGFTDDHDIVDLLTLEDELSTLLTVKVDIVDARSSGRVTRQGRAEAVRV